MDWPERLGAAIDCIEADLSGELDLAEAARRAACSPFYFQRLFSIVTGMTVGEYVRRRRLTLAAAELASGNAKVIDVALKYGYDSPDAFTRAFRALHGVTPRAAREPGVALAACPRVSFHVELKGGNDMDYKLIEKPGFEVALTTRRFTTQSDRNFRDIPRWWQEFTASPDLEKMLSLAGHKPGAVTGGEILGMCFADDQPVDFAYGIAVELPAGADAGPFEQKTVPAAAWAVFPCTLADLQDVTRRIFSEWFPAVPFEHADKPELEVYLPGPSGDAMKCEIWIPVVRKTL